jgi:hypothetical protein
MICITSEILSQKNTDLLFGDIECLSKIVNHGIEKKAWNLDDDYPITDSVCSNYLSSKNLNALGDTLLITPIDYFNEGKSNFVGIKATIDSDSSATVYWLHGCFQYFIKGEKFT